jgi:hypothetical protein
MSFQPIKTALRYASAWSLVTAFMALLTIIFSFLGALFCAALGGMMMGATKASARLSVFYSLLCPGVLFGVMRSQKTELAQRQILVLVFICLAAFWAIYLLSVALMAQEQKVATSNGNPAPAEAPELPSAVTGLKHLSPGEPGPLGPGGAAITSLDLLSEALEGHWCGEVCDQDGRPQKRILEIKDGALILSTLDAEGQLCCCAQGRLKLEVPEARTRPVSVVADDEFTCPAI